MSTARHHQRRNMLQWWLCVCLFVCWVSADGNMLAMYFPPVDMVLSIGMHFSKEGWIASCSILHLWDLVAKFTEPRYILPSTLIPLMLHVHPRCSQGDHCMLNVQMDVESSGPLSCSWGITYRTFTQWCTVFWGPSLCLSPTTWISGNSWPLILETLKLLSLFSSLFFGM